MLRLPQYRQQNVNFEDVATFVARCFLASAVLRAALILIVLLLIVSVDSQALVVSNDSPATLPAPSISARMWFDRLVVAPIWETMVFQCLPVELLRRGSISRGWQFVIAFLPFALVHVIGGPGAFLMAGASGVLFAHCYLELRPLSRATAVAATIGLHSASNFLFPWIAQFGRSVFT